MQIDRYFDIFITNMAPEFKPGVAEDIAGRNSRGKFVRNGGVIWVEEKPMGHREIAKDAGFINDGHFVVDDAGQFRATVNDTNTIGFYGDSLGFGTKTDGPARDETIKIAQETAGDSVNIRKI